MGDLFPKRYSSKSYKRSKDACFASTSKQRAAYTERKYNAFNVIFTIAMCMGFPVTSSNLTAKQMSTSKWVIFWCFFTIFCRSIMLVLACVYSQALLPSTAAQITYNAFVIFGYVNALVFIKKKNEIESVVRVICHLTMQLGCNTSIGKPAIKRRFIVASVAVLVIVGIHIQFFFFQEWDAAMMVIPSPFPKESSFHHRFVWLVLFSIIYAFNLSGATTSVILLLCDDCYYAAGKLLDLYGKKLRRDLEGEKSTSFAISQNLSLFRRITAIIRDTDSALSGCAFFIYAVVVTTFFNSASVLLSPSKKFRTSLGDTYVSWTLLCALLIFFVLTYSGAKVSDKSIALKVKLLHISNSVINESTSVPTILMFNLLFENIKTTNIYMTGLGLFIITRGFILTIAGTVITYGVLIYQMGANQ